MRSKLLGHSANDLFWFILPLVLPTLLIRYDLSYTQAGGILTVYLAVTALFSFIMGKLSDRFSRRTILSYGFLLASAGLITAGFAPSLAAFLLLMSITAVGVSTFHPVMYAVIDESYPERKGRVMGIYEVFGTTAILLMFLINGFLLQRIGVRGVLIITALPGLAMGLTYRFTRVIPETEKAESSAAKPVEKPSRSDLVRFVLFLLSVILRVMSVTAVLNFLPTIFVSFFGFAPGSASYATAFFFAGGIAGSLVVGKISDRINSFRILLTATVFLVPSVLSLTLNLPHLLYPVVVALFGGFGSSCIINQNLLMSRLGKHLGKGEVFGILMGVMTITSSLSPALFGLLIDNAGFKPAVMIFTVPLVLSTVLLLVLLKSDLPGKALPAEPAVAGV